jgi:hypothetical protein
VYAPGKKAFADVVSSYFPTLPVVQSKHLTGSPVAVVVRSDYRPASSASPAPTAGSSCDG